MDGSVRTVPLAEFEALVGAEIGVSGWREIPQSVINAFADMTDDHQYIHVNPELASLTPFGGTIAHGFYVLSLLSAMNYEVVPAIEGTWMGVNYGFDRLRFVSATPSGSRVRARFRLKSLERLEDGRIRTVLEVTVEIEGRERPAIVADWISMVWVGDPAAQAGAAG